MVTTNNELPAVNQRLFQANLLGKDWVNRETLPLALKVNKPSTAKPLSLNIQSKGLSSWVASWLISPAGMDHQEPCL